MKVSKEGFSFKYHGDVVLRYWPWIYSKYKYRSQLLSRDFNSFPEYWMAVGEESTLIKTTHSTGKLSGFDIKEVLGQWSARLYPAEYIVILFDINHGAKGPSFWSRLTVKQKSTLLKDYVVLRCKDKNGASALIESIAPQFASAFVFLNGEELGSNLGGNW